MLFSFHHLDLMSSVILAVRLLSDQPHIHTGASTLFAEWIQIHHLNLSSSDGTGTLPLTNIEWRPAIAVKWNGASRSLHPIHIPYSV